PIPCSLIDRVAVCDHQLLDVHAGGGFLKAQHVNSSVPDQSGSAKTTMELPSFEPRYPRPPAAATTYRLPSGRSRYVTGVACTPPDRCLRQRCSPLCTSKARK